MSMGTRRRGVGVVGAWLFVPAGTRCVPGVPVPIELRVGNTGTGDLWFVGVLDGSETASRYPWYLPGVTNAATGELVAAPGAAEDGLTAPLRRTDFHRLRPGETFDPASRGRFQPLSTFANFAPPEPGTYSYRVLIDTMSEDPRGWLGRFGQDDYTDEALVLLAKVPRVRIATGLDVVVSVPPGSNPAKHSRPG